MAGDTSAKAPASGHQGANLKSAETGPKWRFFRLWGVAELDCRTPLEPPEPLMPDTLTWTALLAHWTDMARVARALDGTAEGPMVNALSGIITCQALQQALPEVLDLPEDQRSLAMDQAAVLLRQVDQAIEDTLNAPPPALQQSLQEAHNAFESLHLACVWTMVWEGPEPLTVPPLPQGVPARGDEGLLLAALPGTVLLPGTPLAWWQGRNEPMLGHWVGGVLARPRISGVQVWRRRDDQGGWARDEVREANDDGPDDGVPLLVPRVVQGARLQVPEMAPDWIGAATPPANSVPVNWVAD